MCDVITERYGEIVRTDPKISASQHSDHALCPRTIGDLIIQRQNASQSEKKKKSEGIWGNKKYNLTIWDVNHLKRHHSIVFSFKTHNHNTP